MPKRPSNRFVLLQALFAFPFMVGAIIAVIGVSFMMWDGGRITAESIVTLLFAMPFLAFGGVGMYRLHVRYGRGAEADSFHRSLQRRSVIVNVLVGAAVLVGGISLTWFTVSKHEDIRLVTLVISCLGAAELVYGLWQGWHRKPQPSGPSTLDDQNSGRID